MKRKVWTIRLALVAVMLSLLVVPLAGTAGAGPAAAPTVDEVRAAIAQGVEWLAIRPKIRSAPRIVRPGPVD